MGLVTKVFLQSRIAEERGKLDPSHALGAYDLKV